MKKKRTEKDLKQIRNTRWYQRWYCAGEKLKEQGFSHAKVKIALETAYGLIDETHGFRYRHIAYSASDSLVIALTDLKRKKQMTSRNVGK